MLLDLVPYVIEYRRAGVLLDTNLLLFILLAQYDLDFAVGYKRTRKYDLSDFLELSLFLKQFDRILTTPQVLGEVWSFIEEIKGSREKPLIKSAIDSLLKFVECYTPKDMILAESSLTYLGVTDVSVICSAKELGCLVLTDDLRAHNFYLQSNVIALNINHFRVNL
jgi:hypothetical protein